MKQKNKANQEHDLFNFDEERVGWFKQTNTLTPKQTNASN